MSLPFPPHRLCTRFALLPCLPLSEREPFLFPFHSAGPFLGSTVNAEFVLEGPWGTLEVHPLVWLADLSKIYVFFLEYFAFSSPVYGCHNPKFNDGHRGVYVFFEREGVPRRMALFFSMPHRATFLLFVRFAPPCLCLPFLTPPF